MFLIRQATLLAIAVLCFLVSSLNGQEATVQKEKLTAFTRAFGYVRYFHPSDQSSLVDWESMALHGVTKVFESPDDESVETLLTKIFDPVVVDLEFYRGEEKAKPKTQKVSASKILAWQHRGVGCGTAASRLYKSARTNRSKEVLRPAAAFGNLMQSVNAKELRGKEIRFRFQAKTLSPQARLQGWLRVDRESKQRGFFDNMGDRPIEDDQWAQYEITGTVDDDAFSMTFGVFFKGSGAGLVDDASLEQKVDDQWKTVELKNGTFEKGDRKPDGWATRGNGYGFEFETDDKVEGDKAIKISRQTVTQQDTVLNVVPELGEVVDASLGGDLRIRMPLALPKANVYKTGDDDETDAYVKKVNSVNYRDASSKSLATSNVVLAWNLFQHFYPYFEQVETDWNAALDVSLASATNAKTRDDVTRTLKWMVAQLHDGHGRVMDPDEFKNVRFLPATFGWAEEQLVVLASESGQMKVGDVVTHVNAVAAKKTLESKEELISGSPQWKRHRSLSELSYGKLDQVLALTIDRQGTATKVEVPFSLTRPLKREQRPKIDLVVEGDAAEENIYYIDMGRVEPKDVQAKLTAFAKAKGLIVDLRGYPKGTQFLFQHMSDRHLQSAKWQVPEQIHPDRADMKVIKTMGRWEMPPKEPKFAGEFIFITNGSAISYAESCMAIVANYKFAEIIGSPTAGANGNVNPFALPGNYRVSWTGMRVMNHDDSPHHVRGVQPTIPMEPTVKGIREGRDELFDKALEMLKGD